MQEKTAMLLTTFVDEERVRFYQHFTVDLYKNIKLRECIFLKTLLPITVHLGIDILLTHFAMLGIKLDMTKKLTQVLLRRPLGNICFSEK